MRNVHISHGFSEPEDQKDMGKYIQWFFYILAAVILIGYMRSCYSNYRNERKERLLNEQIEAAKEKEKAYELKKLELASEKPAEPVVGYPICGKGYATIDKPLKLYKLPGMNTWVNPIGKGVYVYAGVDRKKIDMDQLYRMGLVAYDTIVNNQKFRQDWDKLREGPYEYYSLEPNGSSYNVWRPN